MNLESTRQPPLQSIENKAKLATSGWKVALFMKGLRPLVFFQAHKLT